MALELDKSSTRDALVYQNDTYNAFMSEVAYANSVLSNLEKRSLFEYSGWAFKDYQLYLKDQTTPTGKVVKEGLPHMDSALAKSSNRHDLILYHGLAKEHQTNMDRVKDLQFAVKNKLLIRTSFFSTSVDPKVASDVTGGVNNSVVFEIFSSDGIALGEETSECGIKEKEVLLPRGKSFEVLDVIENVSFLWGFTKRIHTVIQLRDLKL